MMKTHSSITQTSEDVADTRTAGSTLAALPQTRLQEQLLAVAQAVPGFLYTTHIDADGNSTFPFASDGIEDLIGLRPEDIRNNATLLHSRFHPDDLPELMERIQESSQTLVPFRHEVRVFHPEHGLRWVDMRSTPRRLTDDTIEAHGLMLDITERKIAEIAASNRYSEIVQLNERIEESARSLKEYAVELEATHQQLKTTEAWYRGILEAAPDGMLVVNAQGVILLVNAQLTRMFGYAASELIGQRLEVLIPTDAFGGHDRKHQSLVGVFDKFEYGNLRGCRKDGSEFPIDVTQSRIPGTDFSEGTVCTAIRDITDRKRAEKELREREALVISLLDAMPVPVFFKDRQGRFLGCNQAYELFLLHTKDQLRGKTVFDIAPREYAEIYHAQDEALYASGSKAQQYETQVKNALGEIRNVVFHKAEFADADGTPAGLIGAILDVTERKAAEIEARAQYEEIIQLNDRLEENARNLEEQATELEAAFEQIKSTEAWYRSILQSAPDGMLVINERGTIMLVNAQLARMFGYVENELIGQPMEILVSPDFRGRHEAMRSRFVERMQTERKACCIPNLRGYRKDGSAFDADVSLSRLPDTDFSETTICAAVRDITERKKMEEALTLREREFRSLAENLPVPVFRYDRQLRRVYVNPFVVQQIRTTASALIGRTPAEVHVIGPREAALMQESIQRVFDSGEKDDVEVKYIDVDGDEHWYRMANVPEFGPDGEVQHVLSIGNDETKLHELEIELYRRAALEEQVSSLAQAAPGFLFLARVEADGCKHYFPFASEGVVDLFGVHPEDIQGDAEVLQARYHPEDRERIRVQLAESIRTLLPYSTEIRIEHPVKGERWVEIRGTPRRQPDGTTDIHGLMFDITDRKRIEAALAQREHEFRTLVENAKDVVVRYDRECRRVYMNPAWERVNGISAQYAIGKSPVEFSGNVKKQARELVTALRRVMESARSEFIDLNWRDESGQPVCFQMEATPEFDTAGTVVSVLTVSRDISERKRMEEAIREGEARYRQIFDNAQEGIALMDVMDDGDFIGVEVNAAFGRLVGIPREAMIGKRTTELLQEPQASEVNAKYHRCLMSGRVYEEEIELELPVGIRTFYSTMVPVRDDNGRFARLITITRDITERKRMEETLIAREREFRTLIENTPDIITRFGRDLRRQYVNPALVKLFDADPAELIGSRPSIIPGDAAGVFLEKKLAEVFDCGLPVEFEYPWQHKNGKATCHLVSMTPEFCADGRVNSVLAVGRDISELNAFRHKIHQMAFYDTLTSLPNRALFNDRLRQMITDASWHGQSAGVMMIDLDRFKAVNDTMGHAIGDELLRETAVRLSACVRSYDTVARLGGDEFAVLLPEIREGADLGRIASKMLEMLDERFLLGGKEVFVSCSIGIALYPDDSIDPDDLVKYADSAMYFAKHSGRNGFRFYAKELTASANKRLTLESELRRAIERQQLELFYQPKVLLEDGTLIGSEALLRWRTPRLGMVPPDQFIQIAEDTGLIVEIGKWVLREACLTAAEWNATGLPAHKVAINLSARQFQANDLGMTIASILNETACRPEWIELEITESLLLDEDGKALEILNSFRAMGISIAIDDFGTGYSALSYLARFPIDTLKIDKSFINTITTDNYHAELVRSILSIARCLGQQVVAEGVETVEQSRFLMTNGCKIAQGYLYSKPLPKSEFNSFKAIHKQPALQAIS